MGQTITPMLAFKEKGEEAVNLYVSVIKNSKILSMMKSDGETPIPKGQLLHASFVLNGIEFTAMDGGPSFSFSEGFSIVATCDTQAELDEVWQRLTENGGEEGRCGWLKDRFGVSWQVIPKSLGAMMSDPARGNSRKMMEALMKMDKIDIATLERAYKER
jgi:predicted 3-demethylubiquinone-9 3-methyltransferase (glyoxalase superfamily)